MADVVYKRSFYDKLCRTVVGFGLLYAYTKGVVNFENFKRERNSDYRLQNISGNEFLMYKSTGQLIRIDQEWFSSNTNKTFSVESLDSILQNISRK